MERLFRDVGLCDAVASTHDEARLLNATAHPPDLFLSFTPTLPEFHLLLSSPLAAAAFWAVLAFRALPSVPMSCTVMMVALNFRRALYALMAVLK